jgi:hypothetical protein
MSKPITIKLSSVQRLIADHPEKAAEMLWKCCHDETVQEEIKVFLIDNLDQQPKSKPHRSSSYTAKIDNIPAIPAPITPPGSHRSHRSGSFSDYHRTPNRNHAAIRGKQDPSPTRSGSMHSKSSISKSAKEYIFILATSDDEDLIEHPARMKSAQVEHSVINDNMFAAGRICGSNIEEEIPEQEIAIPCRRTPEMYTYVTVSSCAKLTWRRSSSDATHKTLFYLVPQEYLDIDVLLGIRDSGEGTYRKLCNT